MVGSQWTSLTSDLVKAVVWPVAIGAIVVVFRTQLAELIGRIKHLGMGAFSVDTITDEVATRVTQAAATDLTPAAASTRPALPRAEDAPAVVHESWRRIERRLPELAGSHHVNGSDLASLADGLADKNVISSHLGTALRQLQRLVDQPAQAPSPSGAAALAQSADWIANILEAVDRPAPVDRPVAVDLSAAEAQQSGRQTISS